MPLSFLGADMNSTLYTIMFDVITRSSVVFLAGIDTETNV
jgi:hypothetical protein